MQRFTKQFQPKIRDITATGLALVLGVSMASDLAFANRGLPDHAQKDIHTLFDFHKEIVRKVDLTESGYIATTESERPEIVEALQSHVAYMSKRLESGLRVRRWDPAFDEYVRYFHQMTHHIRKIPKGIEIEVVGNTAEAILVARNHANVISQFVQNGWTEHDAAHPPALENSNSFSK